MVAFNLTKEQDEKNRQSVDAAAETLAEILVVFLDKGDQKVVERKAEEITTKTNGI